MTISKPPPNPQVTRFCRQFLQLEAALDFPPTTVLCDADTQQLLYEQLFSEEAALPLPPRYQYRILKHVMARIEKGIVDWDEHSQEISDDLMDAFARLLSLPMPTEAAALQQRCYVTYHLSLLGTEKGMPDPHITVLESRSLFSASGTTGRRTWEASLHLGQYLCKNASLVRGKRVLELGSGTGYIAVLCAKYLGAKHFVASDGSDDVINNLPDSLFLNGLQGADNIALMDLKWGHALVGTEDDAWNGGNSVDVVLGGDLTYDARLFPSLLATLQELAVLFPAAVIVIAATERSAETFQNFLRLCDQHGFIVSLADFPVPRRSEQNGPFYDDQLPIHICRLRHAATADR